MRNRKSPVYLAAIKATNTVVELNTQATRGQSAGGGPGDRSALAAFRAASHFLKKKKIKIGRAELE